MAEHNSPRRAPKRRWLLPILCYAAAALVYLLLCTVSLLRDSAWAKNGTLEEKTLSLGEVTLESLQVVDEAENAAPEGSGYFGKLVSTDGDPQLLYQRADGAAFAPGIVVFDAAPHRPTGEIVAYYTTKPAEGFSDTRRVWATLDEAGRWQFDLTGKKVYSLRIDPDSVPEGVLWDIQSITLGTRRAPLQYYVPDAREWLLLLALPLLFWALLHEAAGALHFALGGRWAKWAKKRAAAKPASKKAKAESSETQDET